MKRPIYMYTNFTYLSLSVSLKKQTRDRSKREGERKIERNAICPAAVNEPSRSFIRVAITSPGDKLYIYIQKENPKIVPSQLISLQTRQNLTKLGQLFKIYISYNIYVDKKKDSRISLFRSAFSFPYRLFFTHIQKLVPTISQRKEESTVI